MNLSEEDKKWFTNALKDTKGDLETALSKTATNISETVSQLGKRVFRLESAFGHLVRAGSTAIVEGAKKEHARLVESMFHESSLLLLPPLRPNSEGRLARGNITYDTCKVAELVSQYSDDFEVELAKVGFRLLHKSRSAQRRRKEAAEFIKSARNDFKDNHSLLLQYDKPYALREQQTAAYKFLALVKKLGGELITDTKVHGGFITVNGVRLAPEYLIPSLHRWKNLTEFVLGKVRAWGPRPPIGFDMGIATDVFGAEYAADHGVFELTDIALEDEEMMHT
jgi:hypothetical protein